jgi:PAS domain S-box-containing protein
LEESELERPPSARATDDRDADDLYRLLVETVRDYAIFALGPRGHILTWNAGAERFKGWKAEEIIGRHFSVFYPPEDVAAGKPDFELVVAEAEGRLEDEGWRVRKDGSVFWANVVITALRNEAGTLVGFAKVTRDLSERRAAEEALRESEERFRLIVQSVRDYGIIMLDNSGRVASWNEGAERITGYTAEEIVGRHFSVFYQEEDLARGKPHRELRLARRNGRFEEEGWRVRKDGTVFWASVIIASLADATGQPIGFTKVTRDLTDRRAAQERKIADARRIAEIESANRAKSEFLATLSHELRTPLNAIGGYVDLLTLGVRGELNTQQLEDLDRIRRSQQRLLGIINDLLNFSRVEAGAVFYDLRPVSLDEAMSDLRPMIEPQAAAKNLELDWGQGRRSGLFVTADESKVEQVLLNLLTNAVKFTPAGGRIGVSQQAQGDRVAVLVEDTGIGIPPEQLERVFEPFVQVGRSLSSSHEGAGLGLAISRELARAMGGDLTVKSALGEGSTFTLWLPGEDAP